MRRTRDRRSQQSQSSLPWITVPGCLAIWTPGFGETYNGPGPITAAGTTPPTLTVIGTSTGRWDMRVEITTPGARGVAAGRWSAHGTSGPWTAFTTGALVPLTGTGFSAMFPTGDYSADNVYTWQPTVVSIVNRISGAPALTATSASTRPKAQTLSTGAPAVYFDPTTQDVLTCAITVAQPCTIYTVEEWDDLSGYGGWGGAGASEITHVQYDGSHVYQSDIAHQLAFAAAADLAVYCCVADGASSAFYSGITRLAQGDIGTNGLTGVSLGKSPIVLCTSGRKYGAFGIWSGVHDDATRIKITKYLELSSGIA